MIRKFGHLSFLLTWVICERPNSIPMLILNLTLCRITMGRKCPKKSVWIQDTYFWSNPWGWRAKRISMLHKSSWCFSNIRMTGCSRCITDFQIRIENQIYNHRKASEVNILLFWTSLEGKIGLLSSILGFLPSTLGFLFITLGFLPSTLREFFWENFWYFCQNIYPWKALILWLGYWK